MRNLVPGGLAIASILVFVSACDETEPGPQAAASIEAHDVESLVAPTLGAATMVESLVRYLPGLQTDIVIVTALEGDVAFAYVVMPDGERRALREVMDEERIAWRARFGVLTPELAERVALAPTSEVEFSVLVTADWPEPTLPYDGTDQIVPTSEYRAWVVEHRERVRLMLDATKAPILAHLAARGVALTNPQHLPILRGRGPAALLADPWLQTHASIARIELVTDDEASLLGYAGKGSMAFSSIADSSVCGGTCAGGDWTIGIWEQDARWLTFPGMATGNTRFDTTPVHYLHDPPTCSSDANCPDAVDPQDPEIGNASRCKVARVNGYASGTKFCVQEHLTHVAASVGMKGSYTYPAGDPRGSFAGGAGTGSVDFYVGNESGIAGFDYLMSNALTYVNRSMSGATGDLADAIDWSARYDTVLTTLASGNTGTQTVQCRASWNALCVGSYDYKVWNSTSDDRRSSWSSYLNATNVPVIGLERPHVLGPGNYVGTTGGLYLPDIRSTSSTMFDEILYDPPPFNHYQLVGTSLASPAMLSVALAAHQHEGWFSNLAYPIVRKAVVMAATVDANGDGEVKASYLWSASGDGQDGTGHPNGTRLNALLDSNQYRFVSLSDSSFVSCGAGCREYTVTTVTAAPNQRIKAALVWNACSTGYDVSADLANDLDLVLQRPAFVTCQGLRQSIATVSEVEAIYDACLSGTGLGGTYTLKIRIKDGETLAACNGSGVERAAVAWSLF